MRKTSETIIFSHKDLKGIQAPYDDEVMISVMEANFEVQKIMIDSDSFVDILFYDTFQRIKLLVDRLMPM